MYRLFPPSRPRPLVLITAHIALLLPTSHQIVDGEEPQPPMFSITDLGILPVSGLDTKYAGQVRADIAYAVNAHGVVAGEAFIPGGGDFAFRYEDGVVTSLGTIGTAERPTSQARGINNRGQVVGYYCSDTAFGPFLWDKGTMKDLGTLRQDGKPGYGIAYAINDAGQVVGEASSTEGHGHACLWRDGRITDLGVMSDEPNIASAARGINRRGEVVGYSGMVQGDMRRMQGFLWREGKEMIALRTLCGVSPAARASRT